MKRLITLAVVSLLALTLSAQAPQRLSYQAVIRNSSGGLVTDHTVGMRISILQGSASGTAVYVETHTSTTNANGLATIEIGGGSVVSGTFAAINWSDATYYCKTETDPAGGTSYSITGTSQLISVPYALHAKTVQTGDNWGTQSVISDATLTGTGTTSSPLKLAQQGASAGQVLKWTGTTWDNAADNTGPWTENDNYIYSSSGKKFGIGINVPSRKLTIAEPGTDSYLNIQNGSTGYNLTDGLLLGMQGLIGWLATYEAGNLNLGTSGMSRLSIDSEGEVGIGTTNPGYKLDVTGAANLNKGLDGTALRCNGAEAIWYNGTYFSWGYGGTWNFFGDKIFIGAVAADPGTNLLVVNGAAAKPGGGSWATWSDARLKDIHGIYSKGLNEIIKLKPVSFFYKAGNKPNLPADINYTGLIAQEVRKIFPEAVSSDGNGFLQLDIQPVNMALINAVRELKAENDELKARLERLEAKVGK